MGFSPAAPVQLQVIYLDNMSNSVGNGLFVNVPVDRIPTADNDTWLEIYQTTTQSPPGATQAFILINSLPLAGTSDILVDDVALLTVQNVLPPPSIKPAYGYAVRTFLGGQDRSYVWNEPVDLNVSGPLNDVMFTTDGLQVQRTGTYHVQFTVTTFTPVNVNIQSGVTLSVRVDGNTPTPQYFGQAALSSQTQTTVFWPQHSSVILELNAGDIVQIVPIDVFGIAQYRDAYCQVIQII